MTLYGVAMPAPTPHGLLGRLITESANTRARLDLLTQQAASGTISHDYAGLGTGARTVLSLRPLMTVTRVWQGNIDAASARMQITQTAMDRLTAIASDFYARVNALNGLSTINVDVTAAAARDALREVAGLLNTKAGDVYVFSGRDTANPPVPSGNAILGSGFYTQIAATVGGLSGAGALATATATLAIAGSNAPAISPFSLYLSQSAASLQGERPVVETGDLQREPIGILASSNAAVVSGGPSTTGSYMRDLLRSLATIGALSSSQISDAGFSGLVDDTRTSLRDAIAAISSDAGILGDAQARLTQRRTTMDHAATALTGQVASIEDADMAAVLSQLSQTQIRLQSSYQMIGAYSQLSLAKFLS